MKSLVIALLFLSLASFATEIGPASPVDPVTMIKTKDAELQQLLRKKIRTEKDTEKLTYLINSIFDFQMLGKKSLPTTTWKEQDSATQATFVSEFQRMVESSSVKKLEVYKSDSTTYETAVLKDDEAKVTAHVWYKGKESVLLYKLNLVDGKWRAWDLVIDDLSTARNYREQFSKILKDKSFKDLIEIIRKKADGSEE